MPKLTTPTDTRVLNQYILDNYKNQDDSKKYNQIILTLVSKLRIALLEIRRNLPYQKKLFGYFNNEYRKLNKEDTVIYNASSKVIDKTILASKVPSSISQILEKVLEIVRINTYPIATDKADVFTVWNMAMDIIDKEGKGSLNNKVKFFNALIKAINEDRTSYAKSYEDGFRKEKAYDDGEGYDDNGDKYEESENDDLY